MSDNIRSNIEAMLRILEETSGLIEHVKMNNDNTADSAVIKKDVLEHIEYNIHLIHNQLIHEKINLY